jgi:hypothetical protein
MLHHTVRLGLYHKPHIMFAGVPFCWNGNYTEATERSPFGWWGWRHSEVPRLSLLRHNLPGPSELCQLAQSEISFKQNSWQLEGEEERVGRRVRSDGTTFCGLGTVNLVLRIAEGADEATIQVYWHRWHPRTDIARFRNTCFVIETWISEVTSPADLFTSSYWSQKL